MRVLLLGLLVSSVSAGAPVQAQAPASGVEVPFEEVSQRPRALPAGFYVFRDSVAWAAGGRSRPAAGGGKGAASYDFSRVAVVALSYGFSYCVETGGGVERITRTGDAAVVSLTQVHWVSPACLASLPRELYYVVSKADLPDSVAVTFEPADPSYDFDPQGWYPLAVGNAWHFRSHPHEWVEVIDEEGEDGWHRVRVAHCEPGPCPAPEERYLRWTDDHYLLTTETPPGTPGALPDTLHPTTPRSVFTADTRWGDTLEGSAGATYTHIMLWQMPENFEGHFRLEGSEVLGGTRTHFGYLYGIGPHDWGRSWLVAAFIDGEDFEDTALIRRTVSTPSEAPAPAPSAIHVYPHPATEASVLTFTPAHSGSARLVVYDLLGRLALDHREAVVAGAEWRVPLRAEGLAPGFYLVRVTEPGGATATRSLVVAR